MLRGVKLDNAQAWDLATRLRVALPPRATVTVRSLNGASAHESGAPLGLVVTVPIRGGVIVRDVTADMDDAAISRMAREIKAEEHQRRAAQIMRAAVERQLDRE